MTNNPKILRVEWNPQEKTTLIIEADAYPIRITASLFIVEPTTNGAYLRVRQLARRQFFWAKNGIATGKTFEKDEGYEFDVFGQHLREGLWVVWRHIDKAGAVWEILTRAAYLVDW